MDGKNEAWSISNEKGIAALDPRFSVYSEAKGSEEGKTKSNSNLTLEKMDKINELSDELLIKILSFVPTKVAVSTSILSKRWEFLWMWVPNLDFDYHKDINRSESSCLRYRDFINKNLPLHRAPIIERLYLRFWSAAFQPEDIKVWVGIAVSRCVRELSIDYIPGYSDEFDVGLPSSLYTCKSLVTLKLEATLVDVPRTVCLPSLKTLQLRNVTYLNEDSLRLLLSYCPVLEDLDIERHGADNVKALVVIVPSLQRLSLWIDEECSSDGYVIVTPSLKYFKVEDYRYDFHYLIERMPKLEEADINVYQYLDEFLESITSVKRLSLKVWFNKSMYRAGIVFHHLEHLELSICNDYWSKLLVRLLNDSPKLRVLKLYVDGLFCEEREQISCSNEQSSIPKCLLKSLETFEFAGYKGRPEERDFLSFIFKNARCLKSTSILRSHHESDAPQ